MNKLRFVTGCLLLMISVSVFLSSCKKDREENTDDAVELGEQKTLMEDDYVYAVESESSMDDIDLAVNQSGFQKAGLIAGATIDDSTFSSQKKLVITYNGLNKDGTKIRTGTITVQLITGNAWRDLGSVLEIRYNQFTVTRVSTQKSVTFDGVRTIKNLTGGLLAGGNPVLHQVRGTVTVTFDNGTQRVRNDAFRRLFDFRNSTAPIPRITTTADTVLNGVAQVSAWGTNRKGEAFTTLITEPVIWSGCWNGQVAGVRKHQVTGREITIQYGVNQQGQPVTVSSGICAYGYKIEFLTRRNVSRTAVLAY